MEYNEFMIRELSLIKIHLNKLDVRLFARSMRHLFEMPCGIKEVRDASMTFALSFFSQKHKHKQMQLGKSTWEWRHPGYCWCDKDTEFFFKYFSLLIKVRHSHNSTYETLFLDRNERIRHGGRPEF